jgi:phosphoribosyl 1,2-cyclic phosphodiesterase
VSRRIKDYQVSIFKEIPFFLAGMKITAFDTSHDAIDNMGFSFEAGGKHFVVATDMGVITDRAAHYMQQANYLMIESNYDRTMLDTGKYPEYLKARVRGAKGHLDNEVAAQFVASNYHDGLKWVFLCHLSNDNNTPDVALQAMMRALKERGVSVGDGSFAPIEREKDIQVYALPRYDTSTWFVLED